MIADSNQHDLYQGMKNYLTGGVIKKMLTLVSKFSIMKTSFIIKAAFAVLLVVSALSCSKPHMDCHNMNGSYDAGFYRGPDMRPEADYLIIDGVNKGLLPFASGSEASANCSTAGLLHISLSFGTHTIGIQRGTMVTNSTFVLSPSGVSCNGAAYPLQSCNNGMSFVMEDI